MATINVKLRHSGIQGKTGTIYYRISHRGKTRLIGTSMKFAPEDWLAEEQRIVPAVARTPEGRLLQHRIERDVARLRRIVRELDARQIVYEPDDIVERFRVRYGARSKTCSTATGWERPATTGGR